VELVEGKNREIRRMLESLGHPVTKLMRVAFGSIELGSLQPGEWRDITRTEISPFANLRADRSSSRDARGNNPRRGR
jgi:16S rRNA U516 pseudouridylate synthase RsuA-like enzyme